VAGLSQPSFGQRIIEHDIRLREGEVNLLGGLIQRTTTTSVTGIPGLGEIPLLRYLFSQEHKEVSDQEVLVMLTPRVIRLPEAAASSGRNVAVGVAGESGLSMPENFPPEVPAGPPVGPPNPNQ
jgi:general secretion pathway protein D